MLGAERRALAADILSRRQDVKNMDLNNLVTFLDGLSTQAALIAGFSFAGLTSVSTASIFWKMVLYMSTTFTLGAEMYVVCVGQLTTILGPTLALNGPAGSLERAVYGIRKERGVIFKLFIGGLASFFVEIVAFIAVTVEELWLAVMCELVICTFFVATARYSMRVLENFKFDADKVTRDSLVDVAALADDTAFADAADIDRKATELAEESMAPKKKHSQRGSARGGQQSAAEFLGVADASAGKFASTDDA